MAITVGRRRFISLLGSVAAWPLVARAQQAATPVIGFLHPASREGYAPYLAACHLGLKETGYAEGGNLAIEYRWGEDHLDRLPALAADLVRRNVALIIAGGTPAAVAAKAATATIPIVFSIGSDPVRAGLVASLNRPGGNATGMLQFNDILLTKRLEIMRELVPKATTFGLLVDPSDPTLETRSSILQAAAQSIGQPVRILNVTSREEFDTVFADLGRERIDALLVPNYTLFTNGRERLAALAARYAVPTIYEYREFLDAGGLISYGSSNSDSYRQVGVYAGRVLKGENPADLPVMQPTKFELVINLKAARAIGLAISESFLLRADEVIE